MVMGYGSLVANLRNPAAGIQAIEVVALPRGVLPSFLQGIFCPLSYRLLLMLLKSQSGDADADADRDSSRLSGDRDVLGP